MIAKPPLRSVAAIAWIMIVAVLGLGLIRFLANPKVETDILAMLPDSAGSGVSNALIKRISDRNVRDVIVMVGDATSADALTAAKAFRRAVGTHGDVLTENAGDERWFDDARAFYAPYQRQLLTDAQRARLRNHTVEELGEQVLIQMYGPAGAGRLNDLAADPMQFTLEWWQSRAEHAGVRMPDENGAMEINGRFWIPLRYSLPVAATRLDGTAHIKPLLDAAEAAALRAAPAASVIRAGFPLHAEAAAVRANYEINLIGGVSLVAVMALVFFAFGRARSIFLIALSLVTGLLAAVVVTEWVFGGIHILTLVFGATLIGVAEDYGIHWFAMRQMHPEEPRHALMKRLFPSLTLALCTSAAAYLALGAAALPILRQMAVFSVVGLAASYLTVVAWFAYLDRGQTRHTRFADWIGSTLPRIPVIRWGRNGRGILIVAAVLSVIIVAGAFKLQVDDDLRSMQSSPAELVAQQREISGLMQLPSPAQFFVVTGRDEQDVLRLESQLVARLETAQRQNLIGSFSAISDWVPPVSVQREDFELLQSKLPAVVGVVERALRQPFPQTRHQMQNGLTINEFLKHSVSANIAPQWLGQQANGQFVSVVTVGEPSSAFIMQSGPEIQRALVNVTFVDQTQRYSSQLRHFRSQMTWMLGLGILLVAIALGWRFGRDFWRPLVPTLLAGVLAVALMSLCGYPVQLFSMLALLILLGMGVDYGIFIQEHAEDQSAWLAVSVGAVSTWLTFGMLALSATPALRVFGLTLLFSIGVAWLLTPMFRRQERGGLSERAN